VDARIPIPPGETKKTPSLGCLIATLQLSMRSDRDCIAKNIMFNFESEMQNERLSNFSRKFYNYFVLI